MASPTNNETGPVRGRPTTPPERVPTPRALSKDRFPIALTDGDTILHFDCPPSLGTKEIIVNANILIEASLVFRKALTIDPQRQLSRSVENPQLVKIPDWTHFSGLSHLCKVLHGRVDRLTRKNDDGSLLLLSFAQVAHKYRAV